MKNKNVNLEFKKKHTASVLLYGPPGGISLEYHILQEGKIDHAALPCKVQISTGKIIKGNKKRVLSGNFAVSINFNIQKHFCFERLLTDPKISCLLNHYVGRLFWTLICYL
jgi:hypothetical protein